jgi:GTP-binding protein
VVPLDGTIGRARHGALHHRGARSRSGRAPGGEIVAVAGLPEVTIGDRRPDDPRPLPVSTVDEPSLAITIGINTSPLAGSEGNRLPPDGGSASTRARRQRELRVNPTLRPDAGGAGPRRAAARGARRAVRREVVRARRQPEVLTREIDGQHEPVERVAIDVEDYIGVAAASRVACSLQQMVNHGTGWARMEYLSPRAG